MERKTVDWIAIIVIVAAVIFAGCTELKSDEKKVAELIQKDCEYANDGDWKSMYEQTARVSGTHIHTMRLQKI